MVFNAEALFDIASLVGKPLKVDLAMAYRSCLDRAGVCVEIDASKTLIESILVKFLGELVELKIEFDKKHYYSNHIGVHWGIVEDLCRIEYPALCKEISGEQILGEGVDVCIVENGEQMKILGKDKAVDEDDFTLLHPKSGGGVLERGRVCSSSLTFSLIGNLEKISLSPLFSDKNPFLVLVENEGVGGCIEEYK